MERVSVYNIDGKKISTIQLPEIFSVEIKPHLVHKAVLWQESRKKVSTAHTKTKGERRGGGAKPWRQKGTGRARTGSLRSPIFRKGGVIFGPTSKNKFALQMPQKERRLALFSVLSSKVLDDKIIILNQLKLAEIKTQKMEEILSKLKIDNPVLLAIDKKDEKVQKSARNLPYLKISLVQNLNILDLLKYEYLLITKDSINKLAEIYIGK